MANDAWPECHFASALVAQSTPPPMRDKVYARNVLIDNPFVENLAIDSSQIQIALKATYSPPSCAGFASVSLSH